MPDRFIAAFVDITIAHRIRDQKEADGFIMDPIRTLKTTEGSMYEVVGYPGPELRDKKARKEEKTRGRKKIVWS